MSLRYALLAVLTAQPMTGYDLARTFHASVGHVWNAPNSQIYPELHRMEHQPGTALDRRAKEMIATYVSALNRCKF